jgi:hypothetical protein
MVDRVPWREERVRAPGILGVMTSHGHSSGAAVTQWLAQYVRVVRVASTMATRMGVDEPGVVLYLPAQGWLDVVVQLIDVGGALN